LFYNNKHGFRSGTNYGKVPEAMKNAQKAMDWIEDAEGNVHYEKREVFVEDPDKGCMKHPNRPSRSKTWNPKKRK